MKGEHPTSNIQHPTSNVAVRQPAPILAVLQNQWFKDPEHVKAILTRRPEAERAGFRRLFLRRALFRGCRTGRVLQRVFGEWCDRMTYEEASPEIGGHAGSVFPADAAHLTAVVSEIQPAVVIGFGRVACDALKPICGWRLIEAPHPTARQGDTLRKLYAARMELEGRFPL